MNNSGNNLKILVIRIGRMGDRVMITPAFRALLEAYPSAEFHLLTSTDGKRVFSRFSKRITACRVHNRKGLLEKVRLRRILGRIRRTGYDHIFCFELNPTFKPFYMAAQNGGYCIDRTRPEAHYSRRCLDVVTRATDKPMDNYWLNFPVSEEARIKSRSLLTAVGIDDSTFVVGMHPTYSGVKKMPWRRKMDAGRRWPAGNFAQLATQLLAHAEKHQIPLCILLDLLPEEAKIGNEIIRLSQGGITMITPQPDFQRYAATLQRMNLLVTPDTGPMHIGGAVGTRLVTLFANKNPMDCSAYIPPEHCAVVQSPSRNIADIHPHDVMAE